MFTWHNENFSEGAQHITSAIVKDPVEQKRHNSSKNHFKENLQNHEEKG